MPRFLLHFPDEAIPKPKWRARLETMAAIGRTAVPLVFLALTLVVLFQITGGDWTVNRIREMIPSAVKAG